MLFIDLGNVVVTFNDRAAWLEKIVKSFGGKTEALSRMFEPVADGKPAETRYRKIDLGEIDLNDLYRIVTDEAGVDRAKLPFEAFASLYVSHIRLIPEVAEVLRGVTAPIVVVSNGDFCSVHALNLLLAEGGVKVHRYFISCQHGATKPKIFSQVIRKWLQEQNVDVRNSLYVDDLPGHCDECTNICRIPHFCFDARKQKVSELHWEIYLRQLIPYTPSLR